MMKDKYNEKAESNEEEEEEKKGTGEWNDCEEATHGLKWVSLLDSRNIDLTSGTGKWNL